MRLRMALATSPSNRSRSVSGEIESRLTTSLNLVVGAPSGRRRKYVLLSPRVTVVLNRPSSGSGNRIDEFAYDFLSRDEYLQSEFQSQN